jgi:hypothetical protein
MIRRRAAVVAGEDSCRHRLPTARRLRCVSPAAARPHPLPAKQTKFGRRRSFAANKRFTLWPFDASICAPKENVFVQMMSERISQPVAQWRTIDLRKCRAECVPHCVNCSAVAVQVRHVDQQWFGRDNKVLQAMDRPQDSIVMSEVVLPLNFEGKMHRNYESCPLIGKTVHFFARFG